MTNADPLRVIQITDMHIAGDPQTTICGVDSFSALEEILGTIKKDAWKPDLILATGDLSEDGSASSYVRIRDLLESTGVPVVCSPGNHDDPTEMKKHLPSETVRLDKSVVRHDWHVISLDSQVFRKSHGLLNRGEMSGLDALLRDHPNRPTLIALHHGPIRVCAMPGCRLENTAEFLALLDRHPNVRGVTSGHAHCEKEIRHNGIRILVTPSTFLHATHPSGLDDLDDRDFSAEHALDPNRRGFRRFELHADGRMETNVVWTRGA